MAQMVKSLSAMQKTRFNPWVRKIPWRRKWQSILVFWPEKSHGQGSLEDYSPWNPKELDMTRVTNTFRYTLSESCPWVLGDKEEKGERKGWREGGRQKDKEKEMRMYIGTDDFLL